MIESRPSRARRNASPADSPFASRSTLLALEPRTLYDGAAAVVADKVADQASAQQGGHHDTPADIQPRTVSDADKTTPEQQQAAPRHEILFVDSTVEGWQNIVANVQPNVQVVVLDGQKDPLQQIADTLSAEGTFDAVHIVSHGSAGSLDIGGKTIDLTSLSGYTNQLATIGSHLTQDGDILLYGCDIGEGAAGEQFMAALAQATHADIAASTNATGASDRGGDWVLEASTGSIEAGVALTAQGLEAYQGLLDAPVIGDSVTDVRTVSEDTALIISGISITDAEGHDQTVTLTSSDGTLTLATITGLTGLSGNGTGTVTFTGSLADINAALNGMKYQGSQDFNGDSSFTIKSHDSDSGAESTKTVSVAVTAVNDAPDLSTKINLQVDEGGHASFSLAQLASSADVLDVDIHTGQQVLDQLMMRIDSLPTDGTLTYKGGVVVVGSVIAVSDLADLVYTHNGTDLGATKTVSFSVTVSDGGGGSTSATLGVDIHPVNKAPTISGAPTLIEGQVKSVAPTIDLGDSFDTLSNSTIVIDQVTTGGQGTFFIDINNNGIIDAGEALAVGAQTTLTQAQRENLSLLKFAQNGAEPNAPGAIAPSYRITVTDAGGGTGTPSDPVSKTITVDVQPNNDDPTLVNAHATSPLDTTEGQTTLITDSMLKISDADRDPANLSQTTPTNQLVYTIQTRPSQGEIQLYVGGGLGYGSDGWITLGDGGRFTQADIDAGHVRYYQTTDVTADTLDGFTFTARDSAFGYDVWTDPSNPTGNREGGVRDTLTGAIAIQTFQLNVKADGSTRVDDGSDYTGGADGYYTGDPRPATPGYGGDNIEYTFVATNSMSNGNGSTTWDEGNVGAVDGGYVITNSMLSYTITVTDNRGTPDTSDDISINIPPAETVYTLTDPPPNGTIERLVGGSWVTVLAFSQFTQADIDAGHIRFVSDGSENHTATFGYTVSDGTPNSHSDSFKVDITPVNNRPTVDGGSVEVKEQSPGNDGVVRIDGSVLGMSDADLSQDPAKRTGEGAKDFLWFTVLGEPEDAGSAQHGHLERWDGSAWVAVTVGEWLPSSLLTASADGGTSGLRYVQDGSEPLAYTGKPQVTFEYQVRDDLGDPSNPFATDTSAVADSSGSNQSNLSENGTATIKIIPINNAPMVAATPSDADPTIVSTITGGGALEGKNVVLADVPEGGSATITKDYLTAIDSDNTTVQRQYRLTAVPTEGVLMLNGRVLGVGSTFTQKDIDDGLLVYKNSGKEVGVQTDGYNDKFNFVVSDGILETSGEFHITLKPTNDVPTLEAPSSLDVMASGSGYVNVGAIAVGDVDLDSISTGEVDFLRVEVKWTDSTGTLVAGAMINYTAVDPSTSGTGSRGYTYGKGTNSLIIQGTKAEVQAILNSLQVASSTDRDAANDKLVITVDDRLYTNTGDLDSSGAANGGDTNQGTDPSAQAISAANNRVTKEIILVASNSNDVPTIANSNPSYSVNEDSTATLSGYTLGDVDSFGRNVTVVVELFGPDNTTLADATTQGRLQLGSAAGLSVSSGNNSNTITLTGSMSDVQNALNALKVQARDDFNNGPFNVKVSFSDYDHAGTQNTVDISRVVDVVPVNDAPVLTVPGDKVMDSGTYVDLNTGFNVQDNKDVDQGATDYIEVTITATGGGVGDQISIQTPGTATVVGNDSLSVVVKGTNAEVTAALNSMRYTPSNPNIDQVITVSVVANDIGTDGKGNGTEGTGVDGHNTDSKSFTITISGTNDAPVVTVPPSLDVTEDTSGNLLSGISYTDSDDFGGVEQIVLSVTHGTLDFGSKTGLTLAAGAYGSTTITVEGTKAALNAALATLKYTPTANYHGTAELTVTANDKGLVGVGGEKTDTKTVDITVSPVNDQPTASSDVTLPSVAEDQTSSSPTFSSLAFGYSDATDNQTTNGGGDTATGFSYVAIVGNSATAAQGVWQVSDGSGGWITVPTSGLGTGSALVFESSREVRFVPTADFNGTPGKLTIRLADGSVDLTGSDKISTDASTRFDITQTANGGTGTTGAWNAVNRNIGITVTPVNDAPTRTAATATSLQVNEDASNPSGSTVVSVFGGVFSDAKDQVTGGSSANTLAGIAITGNAASSTQGVWQYSTDGGTNWTDITGVSDTNALVLKTTDQLRFLPNSPDYNGPADALTVRLIDNSGGAVTSGGRVDVSGSNSGGTTAYSDASNAVTLAATVKPLNDAPTLTHTATNPDVTENNSTGSGTSIDPVYLLNSGTVADVDLSTTSDLDSAIFGAGSITVTLTDGIAGDVLQVGALAGIASTSGGTGSTPFVITLKSDATLAQVGAILEAIQYKNTSDNPTAYGTDTDRSYTVVLSDGNNAQGGSKNAGGPDALDAATINGTITIGATNDPPVAVDDTHEITENTVTPISGNVIAGTGSPNTTPDSDPDNLTEDLSISGVRTGTEVAGGTMTDVVVGTDTIVTGKYGTLTIQADGSYSYALDNDNPTVNALRTGESLTDETFSYTLRDTDGLTDVAQLTITIQGHTDGAPTVTPVDGNSTATGEVTVHESGLTSDVPVGESKTASGTIDVTAPDGLSKVSIGGQEFTVAQLQDLAAHNVTLTHVGKGTLTLTGFTGTGDAPTSGTLSYTYTLTDAQTGTSSDGPSETTDTFALVVTDKTSASAQATGTLTIRIVDDAPTAKADTASVDEGTTTAPSTISGNVVSGSANAGDVADRIGADANASPVTGVAFGSTVGTVGNALDGAYGSLTLSADGSYSYSLDNTNPTVNALKDTQTLTETFSYTVTDGDGDTSTATLTITIHGKTDGAPTVTPVDGNSTATGEVTVHESGLTSDGPVGESKTASGTIDVTAPDGLSKVSIGGQEFTVAQLQDLAAHNVTLTHVGKGTLTLTGFTGTGDAPTSGTLSYTYTLTDAQTGTSSDGPSETTDTFALVVTDKTSASAQATGTLTIRIVDDAPTAKADTASVDEGTTTAPSTITGNVVSGSTNAGDVADRIGADANASPVTGVAFGSTVGTVGNALDGAYGSLTLNADGSYSYSLDNTKPVVNALKDGETLTETFSYTVTDGDGDTSTATLTITIQGKTDGAPTVTPVDGNSTATGEVTVHESGLTSDGPVGESKTASGTIDVTAPDGLSKVSIGGQEFTVAQLQDLAAHNVTLTHVGKGTLTLTGFTGTGDAPTSGTLSYTYTLTDAQTGTSSDGPSETTDTFALVVTDKTSASAQATGTLTIRIVDDAPTAKADTASVDEGTTTAPSTITGNVVSGSTNAGDVADRIGADANASPVTGVAFGSTVGTVGNALDGAYGSLTLNADGSYSYSLDNTKPVVNALKDGETLTETFSYTVTDGDGDTSTATLTITIHGKTDGTLTITPDDGNGAADGHVTVNEAGLADNDGSQTNTGTIAVNVPDGLTSVDVGGTTVDLAGLRNLDPTDSATWITITTPKGEITLTGFTETALVGGVPTAGTLAYSYTLTQVQNTPGDDSNADDIALGITDAGGGTATGTLTVHIVDDTPAAHTDTDSVTEDSGVAAAGNVFANDRIGADGSASPGPVTDVAFGGTSGTVGGALDGDYGSLTLNADGSYSYVLDDTNPAVNGLSVGKTLTETFSYTITDGDGDTSTSTLTVTIRGANDAPVTVGTLPNVHQDDSTVVKVPTAGGFTDVDTSDTLTYTATNLPPGLSIDRNTGEITGTLAHDASQGGPDKDGVYHITVTADDGNGGSVTQTFTFAVSNPPPEAHPDTGAVDADSTLTAGSGVGVISGSIAGAGKDVDVDGDPITVIGVVTGTAGDVAGVGTGHVGTPLVGTHGTLVLNADGSYSYSADQPAAKALKAGETATDVFTYAISDGNGGTAYTTLSITVTGIVRALPTPPSSDPAGFIYPASDSSGVDSGSRLVTDPPHIWEMGGREQRVINLSLPMHPVVYVEVTVQREQAMREDSDLLGMGVDLDAVMFREPDLSENSRDLGMDPVIFVRPAVNLAQREQMLMQGRTLGRDGRVSLSADNLLGNNSIFALDKGLHLFHGAHAPAHGGHGDEHTPAQNTHTRSRGAANFTSQLRQADPSRPAASNSRVAPAVPPSRTASPIPTSN